MSNPLSSRPAYQIDSTAVSAQAFYAAACDPKSSVIVEACAGAGKTWMLVGRILRALASGIEPKEVLAITYTRAATGEVKERLNGLLATLAHPGTGDDARAQALVERGMPIHQAKHMAPSLKDLHARVLDAGRGVQVYTFHAWFAQILRAAPRELLADVGLQPHMSLLEDVSEVIDDVLRSFHATVVENAALRQDMTALVQARGRAATAKWLEAAVVRRVELELADRRGTLESSVCPPGDLYPLVMGVDHPADLLSQPQFRQLAATLAADLGSSKTVTAQKAAELIRTAMDCGCAQAMLDGMRAALLTQAGTVRAHLKSAGMDRVVAVLNDVTHASRQHESHIEHLRMVRLSRALLAEYRSYKRSRGLADMADLEMCAQRLLGDTSLSGWMQQRLDRRVRQVLVDEFQDTSPLQWRTLQSWLSGYAGAGGGIEPPALFLVGDAKQAIYRFRRAEPRVFEAAKAFMRETLSGRILECNHTRRNAPAVVQVLNQVFEDAGRRDGFAGFVPHTTSVVADAQSEPSGVFRLEPALRNRCGSGGQRAAGQWRDSLEVPRREPETVARMQEAKRVAQAVSLLVERGTAPGDIMVLSRKRSNLLLVQLQLRALGVPYVEVESSTLADATEVLDLIAAVEALVSTGNDLALARALRSPMFSVGDEGLAWLAATARQHGKNWYDALQMVDLAEGPVDEVERHALVCASEILSKLSSMTAELGPHDLFDAVLTATNYKERVAQAAPEESVASALKAVDMLMLKALELGAARFTTPYGFVRALKKSCIKHPGCANARGVRLLTVHGAKGLEAKVVFLIDAKPEAKHADTSTILVDWAVHDTAPGTCAFLASASKCPPSLAALAEAEGYFRRREELNGLYVAMTRACRQLVVSCTQPYMPPRDGLSWWDRIHDAAVMWDVDAEYNDHGNRTGKAADTVSILALPTLSDGVRQRLAAVAASDSEPRHDDVGESAQLGVALMRVLEMATPTSLRPQAVTDEERMRALCGVACEECGLPFSAAEVVQASARRILDQRDLHALLLSGHWAWAGNEVPVVDGASVRRIDRLVCFDTDAGRTWWVLDYKPDEAPETQSRYSQQLERYRLAIERLQPGDEVVAAFITGTGELQLLSRQDTSQAQARGFGRMPHARLAAVLDVDSP